VDPKPRHNRRRHLQILRSLSPDDKLRQAFELSDLVRQLFYEGLRRRYPDHPPERLHQLYLERLAKCHNRNY
jgi:hypothetical protein